MLKPFCALALLGTVIGCGGSKSTSGPPTPTPTPSGGALIVCAQTGTGCANPAVVPFGGTAQFTATAATGTPPTVNWSVNGVAGGSSATGTISADRKSTRL